MDGARTLATSLVTAIAALAAFSASASAAPVSGGVGDARDALIDASTLTRNADVRAMQVTHEPDTGELTVAVDLWAPLTETAHGYVSVSGALSFMKDNVCTPYQTAELSFSLGAYHRLGEPYRSEHGWLGFNPTSGYTGGLSGTVSVGDGGKRYVAQFKSAALVRQNIRCVEGLSAWSYNSSDEVGRFCLGSADCFGPAKPSLPIPAGLTVVREGDGQIELDWADVPNLRPGDAYQVYVNDRAVNLSVGASRYVVTGLTNGTPYRFRVSAGRPGSYGDWSQTAVVGTPVRPNAGAKPAVPSGLRIVAEGDGQVALDWADSPDLRKGDSYQVYVNDRAVNLSVTGSEYVVTGLSNGTAYRFRVSAGQGGSYGDWSTPVGGTPRSSGATTTPPGTGSGTTGPTPIGGTGTPGPTTPGGGNPGPGAGGGGPNPGTGGGTPTTGTGNSGTGSNPGTTPQPAPVSLRVLAVPTLRKFAASGLRVRIQCTKRCSLTSRLIVGRRDARKLRSRVELARSVRRMSRTGSVVVTLRPPARVLRRMLRLSRLDTTVKVEAVDGEGVVRRIQRRVTFVR